MHGLKNASPLVVSIALGQPVPPRCPQALCRGRSLQLARARQRACALPRAPAQEGLPFFRDLQQVPEEADIRPAWRPPHAEPQPERGCPGSSEEAVYGDPGPSRWAHAGAGAALGRPGGGPPGWVGGTPRSRHPLPAGAGKTVVGFHIVFWFHKSNEEQVRASGPPSGEGQPEGPCILYCGPSNKSVDVLAGAPGRWCGGSAPGCWPRGNSPSRPAAPRTAPEQENGAEAPPSVQ